MLRSAKRSSGTTEDQQQDPAAEMVTPGSSDAAADGRGEGEGVLVVPDHQPEVETINREEEIVKKRKTELTTTRQTETRIKRQLLFEDGKVIEDSGPIVSTNTHEDTDRQETVQTEHRTLGDPTAPADAGAIQEPSKPQAPKQVVEVVAEVVPAVTEEGLLRNVQEEVSVSREQTTERTEVAEQKHFGDFTDEAYLRAVSSGVGDVRELLLSERCRSELNPTGPQIVQHSINSRKVTDSEETNIRQLAKQDGTLVTEKQQTRQHEELYDDELPPPDAPGYDQVDSSGERLIEQKSSGQRYYKQRDEQHVDVVANGRVIGHEMRYAAEQTQLERDGGTAGGDPGGVLSDWDSLSDRLRKARRLGRPGKGAAAVELLSSAVPGVPATPANGQHHQLQQHLLLPAATAAPNDRLDALTKKPLDFDKEEETRKHETNKWLESHFGSESRSSRDSREDLDDDDDDEDDRDEQLVEPTKKTYFNVTIKSNGGDGGGGGSVPDGAMVDSPIHDPRRHLYGSSGQLHRSPVAVLSASKPRGAAAGDQAGLQPAAYRQPRQSRSREDLLFGGAAATGGYHNQQQQQQQQYRTLLPDAQQREHTTFNARYGHHPPAGPEHEAGGRPQVPQRRKAAERRFVVAATAADQQQQQQQQQQQLYHHQQSLSNGQVQYHSSRNLRGPSAIVHGYGSRSRSVSPIQIPPVTQTLARQKPYQKTRFSSIQDLSGHHHHQHPVVERTGTNGSHRSQSTTLPKANRVSSAIGRSFRKLMGKIRSSSAERKLKARNNKQRSPSPLSSSLNASSRQLVPGGGHARDATSTTYQQYNVIDGHISHNGSPVPEQQQQQLQHTLNRRDRGWYDGSSYDRYGARSAGVASEASGGLTTPRQTYYLGENPYGGHQYYGGKENRYQAPSSTDVPDVAADELATVRPPGREARVVQQQQQNLSNRQMALGRFSKSTNRLPTTANGSGQYGQEPMPYSSGRPAGNGPSYGGVTMQSSSQTLPRNDHHRQQQQRSAKPLHSSTINVSIVNHVNPAPAKVGVPLVNTGPVKPARTYKALNRSKSFNVHGLNGTNDPSPIYLEKLQQQQQQQQQQRGASSTTTGFHRSNSHLDQPHRDTVPALKSPSIVNYISRSTRDLTHSSSFYDGADRAQQHRSDRSDYPEPSTTGGAPLDKKGVFLRNLQNRAPELYRTLHEGDAIRDTQANNLRSSPSRDYLSTYITRAQEQAISGATRPGVPSKDTASIVGPRPTGEDGPRHRPIETDLKYQRISDAGAVVIELRNNS